MNYGEMKAAVISYLKRKDGTAMLPVFRDLAEQRIYFGESNSDPLRIRQMLKTTSLPDGALPAGFLEAKKVRAVSVLAEVPDLDYVPLADVGRTCGAFSYSGDALVLGLRGVYPVAMTYYARLLKPVADTDTNWLLENAPGVYLSGMLIEGAKWGRDDALLAREAQNFVSGINSLMEQDRVSQHSGSGLSIAPEFGRTP